VATTLAAGGLEATPPRGLDVADTAADGLPAQAGATDGMEQPAMKPPIDVVARARSLLHNVPLPVIEYNIPVVQVERYIFDALDLLFLTNTVVDSSKYSMHFLSFFWYSRIQK
jgi:hypothetical protein